MYNYSTRNPRTTPNQKQKKNNSRDHAQPSTNLNSLSKFPLFIHYSFPPYSHHIFLTKQPPAIRYTKWIHWRIHVWVTEQKLWWLAPRHAGCQPRFVQFLGESNLRLSPGNLFPADTRICSGEDYVAFKVWGHPNLTGGAAPLWFGWDRGSRIFSTCVRKVFFLNTIPWGWSYPCRSSFFKYMHALYIVLPQFFDSNRSSYS
jgi:hypothetical protein